MTKFFRLLTVLSLTYIQVACFSNVKSRASNDLRPAKLHDLVGTWRWTTKDKNQTIVTGNLLIDSDGSIEHYSFDSDLKCYIKAIEKLTLNDLGNGKFKISNQTFNINLDAKNQVLFIKSDMKKGIENGYKIKNPTIFLPLCR